MKKYDSAPKYKTMADREAEEILLRNAPDEDQLLREYLTKQMHETGHDTPQKSDDGRSVAAHAAIIKAFAVCKHKQAAVMKRLARVVQSRRTYGSDCSGRRNFNK